MWPQQKQIDMFFYHFFYDKHSTILHIHHFGERIFRVSMRSLMAGRGCWGLFAVPWCHRCINTPQLGWRDSSCWWMWFVGFHGILATTERSFVCLFFRCLGDLGKHWETHSLFLWLEKASIEWWIWGSLIELVNSWAWTPAFNLAVQVGSRALAYRAPRFHG